MTVIDWTVMLGTLFFIVGYGIWKTRGSKNIGAYLKGDNQDKWWAIGLSVMATQASAITFLSTPGQGFEDGMRFVQFYFGLPLAMVIISMVFIPLYYRLKVYTAYEFLEKRFDRKTRVFTAMLFLLQRGLAAGITIYAPAIILSQIIGWSLSFTVIFIGVLVILYTVTGGTKAVSQTHKQQMAVIFTGMFIAFGVLVWHLSDHASFGESLQLAGKMGRMNIIDLDFDLSNRYTLWSGLLGGFFLQLSYFGTDQSQVQRYLSGSSVKESRLGLIFNGLVKIPMQFFILLTGVLVFVLYQFEKEPLHFNNVASNAVEQSATKAEWNALEKEYEMLWQEKKEQNYAMLDKLAAGDEAA
ncbi:MAG: sodium:solute symporter, partial [Chitinophagales bacterium]